MNFILTKNVILLIVKFVNMPYNNIAKSVFLPTKYFIIYPRTKPEDIKNGEKIKPENKAALSDEDPA